MSLSNAISRLGVAFQTTAEPQQIPIEPVGPFTDSEPAARRHLAVYVGFLLLVALWGAQLYWTWGAWGNLTIDSGHEMYIPLLLAQAKTLYRDVWFPYGPAGPYITSYLFRLFGVNLNVLYWAGSLSALGSAVFLYLAGIQLSSGIVGWTAGAVVLIEGFQPSLFCFPLPYSFSTVYACLVGCLFIWLLIHSARSPRWTWMFAAGTAACLEMLLKPEFGAASYASLALLIALRSFPERPWKQLWKDVLALLPGVVTCGLVVLWMVSLGGFKFITQENLVVWPTSYFMKTFGDMWLKRNGFTISGRAFSGALVRTIPLVLALAMAYCLLWWRRWDRRSILLKILMALAMILYLIKANYFLLSFGYALQWLLASIVFPRDMVLYIGVATPIAWLISLRSRRRRNTKADAAFALVLTFSTLLAFRILMRMMASEYPIYYNGPVVLCFLFLLCLAVPRSGRSRRFVILGQLFICLACLIVVSIPAARVEAGARGFVPLVTERGTVRVSKHMAEQYTAAIQFMKQKAALGQSVLSVPEDTSLYFLSGTVCPTRVPVFTPGVIAPGNMTNEIIREIDRKPVRYLLWSNRRFPEFGTPVFGKDFDREIGDYLKTHFRPVGPLLPKTGSDREWSAVVWERLPETGPKGSP